MTCVSKDEAEGERDWQWTSEGLPRTLFVACHDVCVALVSGISLRPIKGWAIVGGLTACLVLFQQLIWYDFICVWVQLLATRACFCS